MNQKIIQQGAEAIIFLENNKIIKKRIKKSYRIQELDEKIRKQRTRSESKIIKKLEFILPIPKILEVNEDKKEIIMEFIEGKKLSEHLEGLDFKSISKQIAENIAKLHDQNIIHGDLTTSNMILKDNQIYLIDFGLAFHSHKIEDKAVDLHLIQQALETKHFTIWKECWKIILENYNSKDKIKVLEQLKKVESRGRYKKKY